MLFFLAAGMFALGCEDYLFPGLLPGLSLSLNTGVVAVAQGCTAFGFAYLVSIPLCAFLLSRKTTQQTLIFALLIYITGNLMTFLSPNFIIYLISRFVAGIGSGLFLPVAVGAATQFVEPDFRGRVLGIVWGCNSAGAVLGVPIGLWLAHRLGWQATVLFILFLACFALTGILIRKPKFQVQAPPPSLREQFHLLTDHRVQIVVGVTLLTATGCLGLYSYISQVLAGTPHSPEIAFSLWSIGGLIGSVGIGYVIDRLGQPKLAMGIIIAILFLMITSIPFLRHFPVLGLFPFLIWGAMGWASVTPQQYSLFKIKAGHEAIWVALNGSAVSLGSVIGTALVGLALSSGLDAGKLPYLTSFFLICALFFQMKRIQNQHLF